MKNLLVGTFLIVSLFTQAQGVVPFVDFNRWFRTYENGMAKTIDMQEIKGYKGGDNIVAYIDIRGNLRVYDGKDRHEISNMNVEFQISDNLLAWNVGTTLQMWNAGRSKVLSYFAGQYIVKDNMVVFMDTRYNSMIVSYEGVEYPLQTSTTDLLLINSPKIGENIMVFADNGGLYKIFYKGQTHEIGVWNGDIDAKSGTDIVAFNDPNTRTFAVFDQGRFVDVEDQFVKSYKAGRGFAVYEDVGGNLKMYRNGQVSQLSSYPGKWDVVDDIVVYENNGFTFCDVNGTSVQAANFKISDFKIKNATLAFRNMMGGVSAVVDGKVTEITNMPNAEFEIYGNSVLVSLPAKSYLVFSKGKVSRF